MNKAKGLWTLINRWDCKTAIEELNIAPMISDAGNINKLGANNISESYMLSKNDPEFYDFIESGVKDIVKKLINTLDCITYSSCEGHIIGDEFEPKNIGIIPRNYEEYYSLKKAIYKLITKTNISLIEKNENCDVYLFLEIDKVETDDGPDLTTIEIYFMSLSDNAEKYLNDIDCATNCFLEHLNSIKYK